MKRVYGNTKTKLRLSRRAQRVYDVSWPIEIVENDDGTYDITGIYNASGLTERKLNALLDEDYEEVFHESIDEYDEDDEEEDE